MKKIDSKILENNDEQLAFTETSLIQKTKQDYILRVNKSIKKIEHFRDFIFETPVNHKTRIIFDVLEGVDKQIEEIEKYLKN